MENNSLLIVDDEKLIIEKVTSILKDSVSKIYYALNGKEALEIIKKNHTITCVICDIKMPIMDGIETIKATRELGIEIPFIFYTAHGDDVLINQAVKYGAFDFIDKPSLKNLEDSVIRGLDYGFKIRSNLDDTNEESDHIQSYQSLLDIIKG